MVRPLLLFALLAATAAAPSVAANPATSSRKGTFASATAARLELQTKTGATLEFAITSSTKIDRLGSPATLSSGRAGEPLKVEYTADGSPTPTASSVSFGAATKAGTVFSLKQTGTVDSIAVTALQLKTAKGAIVPFQLDGSTRFERLNDTVHPADVTPGAAVKVKFEIGPDGTLVATQVELGVAVGTGLVYSGKAEGTLASVAGGLLTIDLGGGKTLPVHLAPATKLDRLGTKIGASALRNGQLVEVKLVPGSGGVSAASVSVGIASSIGIVYSLQEKGALEALTTSALTLHTRKGGLIVFGVDGRTRFERAAKPIRGRDLRKGMPLKVAFAVAAGGAVSARTVEEGSGTAAVAHFTKSTHGKIVSFTRHRLVLVTPSGKRKTLVLTAATVVAKSVRLRAGAIVHVVYRKSRTARVALVVRP